jgi:hypothetical protein
LRCPGSPEERISGALHLKRSPEERGSEERDPEERGTEERDPEEMSSERRFEKKPPDTGGKKQGFKSDDV